MVSDRIIQSVKRDIILDGSARYGVSRNVPATDEQGRDCLIALVVIERDNGQAGCSFEVVGINEARIRFQGEQVIQEEVLRRMHA